MFDKVPLLSLNDLATSSRAYPINQYCIIHSSMYEGVYSLYYIPSIFFETFISSRKKLITRYIIRHFSGSVVTFVICFVKYFVRELLS